MEIRRKDRIISQMRIDKVLKEGTYGVLSTIGKDGYPYGVPLNYAYEDGCIYFHCAKEVGHKYENMKYCDKVSFTVVGKSEVLSQSFSMDYESVIVFGTVSEIKEDKFPILMHLINKYSKDFLESGKNMPQILRRLVYIKLHLLVLQEKEEIKKQMELRQKILKIR